jgi:hypothetical protein
MEGQSMNHLAMTIRKLNNGEKDLERSHLTPAEVAALNSIGRLLRMSSADLTTHLQHEDDPTDWLIPPFGVLSIKAIP